MPGWTMKTCFWKFQTATLFRLNIKGVLEPRPMHLAETTKNEKFQVPRWSFWWNGNIVCEKNVLFFVYENTILSLRKKKVCNALVIPWSPFDFGVFGFFSKGLDAKGIKEKIIKRINQQVIIVMSSYTHYFTGFDFNRFTQMIQK